ncbi:MAG: sodium-dependent transporter [Candidatus Methylacidiphilales bacterium]
MASAKGSERWATRMGVILAVTGSAVGLGNFLRFPGLASQYNTAAFMVPYLISLLLVGLPVAWAEWTMARYGGNRGFHSCPGIFRLIWRQKLSPYLGVLGLIVPVMIYMYYVFIESWCLGYAFYYLNGTLAHLKSEGGSYTEFFSQYTGMTADGSLLSSLTQPSLLFLIICVVLNFVLIYRGLSKGIEWFCSWAMPALVLCALILLVRVLTLGTPDPAFPDRNVLSALAFMWDPVQADSGFMESLMNPQMWLDAAGQIFFSLSVGFGVIITYASYLRSQDDLALSSTTSVAGNEFCEVALGGMIIIPVAFLFLGAEMTREVRGSSFGLGFESLPLVFETMPAGRFFGFVFFFLLFLAAITSSLSMLQPAIAFLEEGLNLNRKGSVAILGFITVIGTLFIVYFSKDATALDTIDTWVGTLCIFILATVQIVLYGWALGSDRGYQELHTGANIRIPALVKPILKWVTPIFLLVIFGAWSNKKLIQPLLKDGWNGLWESLFPNAVAAYSMGFIGLVFLFFLLLIHQAVARWNKEHPLEGIQP